MKAIKIDLIVTEAVFLLCIGAITALLLHIF